MSAQGRVARREDHRIGVIRVAGATILIGPPSADGLGELARRTLPRTPAHELRVRLLAPAAATQLRRWWLGQRSSAAHSVQSDQALVTAVLRDLQSGRLAAVALPTMTPARGADPGRANTSVQDHANPPQDPGPRNSVSDLDLTTRVLIVVERAARKLPGDMAAGLRSLVTPRSIAMFAAAIAALAIGHAFGAGEAVDVVLVALAYVIGGMAAVRGVLHLASCAVHTVRAKTGADLDEAAAELADAVEELGVAALTLILVRAGSKGGGSGAMETEATAESQEISAVERLRPQYSETRAVERPASAGKATSDGEATSAVSRSEFELAKSPGSTPAAIAARGRVITEFYERNGMGLKLKDEMQGIDLTKPVEVVTFPPPPTMNQYVIRERGVGRFFDPVGGQTPNELGISGEGRVLKNFETPAGEGLRTTSAAITDTWTTPGKAVACEGGGSQIVVDPATSRLFKLSE